MLVVGADVDDNVVPSRNNVEIEIRLHFERGLVREKDYIGEWVT